MFSMKCLDRTVFMSPRDCSHFRWLREALDRLEQCGVAASISACASLVKQCGIAKAVAEGKRVHACVARSGLEGDAYTGNLLVQMYGSCGALQDARLAFARIQRPNAFSWNIMIVAYAQNGHLQEAKSMLERMPQHDIVAFTALIKECASNGHLTDARSLFDDMPERSVVSWNVMLQAYARNGDLEFAKSLFKEMPQKSVVTCTTMIGAFARSGQLEESRRIFERMPQWDVVSWNAMLAAYAQNGHGREARIVFDEIPQKDVVSWTAMMTAYAQNGNLEDARNTFIEMPERNFITWNALIRAYALGGHLEEARNMFEKMPQRDEVSWNAMIVAYGQNGDLENAIGIFEKMPQPDVVSWTGMIVAYAQYGLMPDARSMFDKIPKKDVASWNAMIQAYSENGRGRDALELFRQMDMEGIIPDEITYICMVDACASIAAPAEAELMHSVIVESGTRLDVLLGTALVNMYSRCGCVVKARTVFDKMPERDVVSWTNMVAAYAQNGHARETLELFKVMEQEGFKPDGITFVGVLSACSHAGLVDDGRHYFGCMIRDHGIVSTESHYACMVDLLSRAGKLKEAEDLINSMPVEPEVSAWTNLMAACRSHGDIKRGKCASESIRKLDPEDAAPYILLSNIHAATTEFEASVS